MNLETRMSAPQHWADTIADALISANPKQKRFICSSGISPSGVVHIGNFRDVITSELVRRALEERGYEAELMFSWDEYDRLRKVPKGVPEEFAQHLWKPLVEVPDPEGCHKSYAAHFEAPFEAVLPALGIHPRFVHQAEQYRKNSYYPGIKTALQKRRKIAEILARFKTQGMTPEELDNYFPLQVYCTSCKRSNATRITDYDEKDKVSYECECGHTETADISKRNIGKLDWKVDWPMRWKHEGVSFEPGGEDHATPGGSFDVAKEIAKEIYEINPPLFQGYGFVGIEGVTKMSSSRGSGITPKELLGIYEPELLRWLFTRVDTKRTITLFFDDQIIRQYDEFDLAVRKKTANELDPKEARSLDLAQLTSTDTLKPQAASFRQVASFGQIAQGNIEELEEMFRRMGQEYTASSLRQRLEKSQTWIERFMPELRISVGEEPNRGYYGQLDQPSREQIGSLVTRMDSCWDLPGLTTLVYDVPKRAGMGEVEKKTAQRDFFKHVYQMLIGKETGPRLPTFLLALGPERVRKLLKI